MKKLVFGIIALAFVFTVSLSVQAQTDGIEKAPQKQKVEQKKECKTASCDKAAKKDCYVKAKCDKATTKEGNTEAKACCKKEMKKTDAKK